MRHDNGGGPSKEEENKEEDTYFRLRAWVSKAIVQEQQNDEGEEQGGRSVELMKDRRYWLKTYRQCCVGEELVDYIMRENGYASRASAVRFAELLAEKRLLEHVTRDHPFLDEKLFYRFLLPATEQDPRAPKKMMQQQQPHPDPFVEKQQEKVLEVVYKRMKQEVPVGHRVGRKGRVEDCFVGSEAIDWLVAHKRRVVATELGGRRDDDSRRRGMETLTRRRAQEFGELLRRKGYIRHVRNPNKRFVDGQRFFRFVKNFEGEVQLKITEARLALELWGKQRALSCLAWPKETEGGVRLFVSESDWPTESGSPEVGTARRRLPPEDRHIERDVKYFGEQLTRTWHLHYFVLAAAEHGPEEVVTGILTVESEGHRVCDRNAATAVDKFRAMLVTPEADLRLIVSLSVGAERSRKRSSSFSSISKRESPYRFSSTREGFAQALADAHEELRREGVRLQEIVRDADAENELTKDLVRFEETLCSDGRRFKWGVLYCKPGQTTEEEMYSNDMGSPEFEDFLQFLGDRILLRTHEGYSGGLSKAFNRYRIMFHVAPYIPSTSSSDRQLARKKHLGNDIVVIVFKDATDETPFDPRTLVSRFNHVVCVVKADRRKNYWVNVACKPGVRPSKPFLPLPPRFAADESFREFLLTKLINAEIEAMRSPAFLAYMRRTRGDLLDEIVERHRKTK